ncbi:phage terminase small subunit P27 family [Oenococcus sp.]|uniref:phage terminase small subunit P27 family n=1 Tax=Oenococcus sp. TaxID=1979414 RepID=UPI0039E971FF
MPGNLHSGRKPDLSNVTAKNTDRRKRAVNANKNNSDFKKISSPPKYLGESSQKLWRFIVKDLDKKGLIKQLDASLLEEYVNQVEISKKSMAEIERNGLIIEDSRGDPKINPAVSAKNNAARNIKAIGSSLGLDPVSRSSMIGAVTPVKKQNDFTANFGNGSA